MNCLVVCMCVQFIHAALKRFVKYQVCFFRSFQYFIQQYCTRSWPHVYIAPNLKKIKNSVLNPTNHGQFIYKYQHLYRNY